MKVTALILFTFYLISIQHSSASIVPKTGSWLGNLQLNNTTDLPFRMVFGKNSKETTLQIKNGEEHITMIFQKNIGDTLLYTFPEFDSDLYLLVKTNKTIVGYWHNKNRKGKYTIPLTAHYCKNELFECKNTGVENSKILAKKWKTEFSPNTNDTYPAIGLFQNDKSSLSGTFLTETGDYRYLDGNFFNDRLYLSCFDGSHAFLFTAELRNDSLIGIFYSGSHYQTDWIAVVDENFELSDPNKLTYVINEDKLVFDFQDINLKNFHYPNENYKDKVTIIQIMGSWCPNCMDETRYYLELYEKYHAQGLEIILIGYEIGTNEGDFAKKLNKLKNRYEIPFTMLIGGAANKKDAAKDFTMLNNVMSFPTSLFVGRDGNITKVHTGFNGPGTGEYYTDYMLQTEKYIQELLKN
ncbi:MAG: peroxiredoxin family protein [Bacteroidota bacterium]